MCEVSAQDTNAAGQRRALNRCGGPGGGRRAGGGGAG